MAKLASEGVVVSSPMSFSGSAVRIWKLTAVENVAAKVGLGVLAVALIMMAWVVIAVWYVVIVVLFGWILVLPFRLLRRGSRGRKRTAMQHREVMAALQQRPPPPASPAP